MFENMFEVAILIVVGLFLGALISLLYWRRQISEREDYIENLETSIKGKDVNMKGLKKRLKEQETELESLNTQLSHRDETISDLTARIKEKEDSIILLKAEVADLEKLNQDSMTRAKNAEATVIELENSVEEKELEITALKARSRAMQDDFAIIVGIGPKVSELIRSTGINTFAKLAATDVSRIMDILEAKNPSLLRLTDPSTWPEQARLAAEGDWEGLSVLQDSLKRGRRA